MIARRVALGLMAIAAVGCSDPVVARNCPSDLRMGTTPVTRTLRVGEAFTATASALGCGGTEQLQESWTWRADDAAVVTVDSLSGRITGRASGSARVTPTGRRYGPGVPVTVTVQ